VAAQRGIRAALLANGVPDVVHLRMADPGSLAAALVADELGIPTVFTLAPDPHGPMADAERRGELDRRNFAAEDARGVLWFRADLVARLASQAREVALFPRPRVRERLRDLVGVDISAGPPRYTVVPEGVDTRGADQAAAAVASSATPAVLQDLDTAISRLPSSRHGLPLAVTVGRMHEIKGMARVVAAFAADADLSARANLVIVGGELAAPSPAEAAELGRIDKILDTTPGLTDRVVLLGHRPNGDVSLVLAAARAGWGDRIGAGGAYVCGSHKEEFGLAIVEAMAAGLPVVAPQNGGPASYVESGVTGVLADTGDPVRIAEALDTALSLANDPETARRTRAAVDDRYTLDRMAQTLAAVYRIASGARTLSLEIEGAA
jgi:glycosyltransferase involved in cell wall biosynthesis